MLAALRNAKHLLAPLTAHCRDFHDRWTAAGHIEPPAGHPTGRWQGEWVSTASGHRGSLHCVLEELDPRRWRASFRAGYAGIFRACYATELAVARSADRWVLNGESDIGWLADGVYHYEGEATATDFVARYRSRFDHGEFRLRRQ